MVPQIERPFNPLAEAITKYANAGLSLIPIDADSKKPAAHLLFAGQWKPYQDKPPTDDELQRWLHSGTAAFAAVCGKVSGGLEILDFDDNAQVSPAYSAERLFNQWLDEVGNLVKLYNLPIQRTCDGFHVAWRCPTPQGNQQLAWVPDDSQASGRAIAIETRGEGGYVILAPSRSAVGGQYTVIQGDFANIPVIPQDVADRLKAAAQVLDLMPYDRQGLKAAKQAKAKGQKSTALTIIAAFNKRYRIGDMLAQYGYTRRSNGRYSRPGKADSAGVSVLERENVSFHWSTNDPLYRTNAAGKPLPMDPFDVFGALEHRGDGVSAVKGAAELLGMPVPASYGSNANGSNGRHEPATADYIAALASLGYTFRWNDLDDTIEVNGQPINDGLAAEIRQRMRDLGYGKTNIMQDAYTAHAYTNRCHPLKEYFQGLTWDGQDHIGTLCAYLEDAHPPIVYADGRVERVIRVWLTRWLVGAIAKLFESGTVRGQNPMLVLDGGQGIGKSQLVRWLSSPFPGRTLESAIRPDNKEHDRYLANVFVWEVAELGATTRRADREALKDFLTRMEVTFRVPYAKHPTTKPAMANFIGTVNNEAGFLTDPTGNRRFLTVQLSRIDWAYSHNVAIDQVWAQAYALYRQGEPWMLQPEEIRMRDQLNGLFEVEDLYEAFICAHCKIIVGEEAKDHFLPTAKLIQGLQEKGLSGHPTALQMGVATALRRLGLERGHQLYEGKRQRGYFGLKMSEDPPF